ncbi:hypothetical protein CRX42_09805 [Pseudomonas jessenii]|uniref:Uncharacterized protein n=1 Tax=Pseudomonas jessenii TaxID=77298 RepID=A0A2W0EQN0_PSEJE|nr:hypothetical protein CRX42_09805 [Pseudomonas jessenii]
MLWRVLPDPSQAPGRAGAELADCLIPRITHNPCGSWLASDSGMSANRDVECDAVIAGKPAPTVFCGIPSFYAHRRFPVGASLLAMVVNDNAGCLVSRGGLASLASRLAPTAGCGGGKIACHQLFEVVTAPAVRARQY